MAALKDKGVVMAVCAMMAVCALGAVAIMPGDTFAATQEERHLTFTVYAGQYANIELPSKGYDGIYSIEDAPSWIGEVGDYAVGGNVPDSPGTSVTFKVIMIRSLTGHADSWHTTVTLNIIEAPNVDFSSPGLIVTPDANSNGATYTVSEDQAIRVLKGRYGYKLPGWWWSEVHDATLTGDTNGLVERSDYWEGHLTAGSYTFTVDVGNKATFNFYVNVTEATRTLSLNANGGSVANSTITVGWGDDFSLPDVTRENFSFAGWYYGNEFVGYAGQSYRLYEDRTLTARWAAEANVQDVTVIANNTVNITPTTDPNATITIEGADWLTVMGNLVTGIAPGQAGDYKVTLTVSGANADPMTVEFTVHVISQLQPTNSPSNGAIVLIVG